jgi:hypothetical protein
MTNGDHIHASANTMPMREPQTGAVVSSAEISSVNSQKFRGSETGPRYAKGVGAHAVFWGAPKGRNRSRASVRRVR